MASLVICPAFAFCTAVRSVALLAGSAPPARAATSNCRASLLKSLPRLASLAPFWCLIVAHFEWPDMTRPPGGTASGDVDPESAPGETRRRRCCPDERTLAHLRARREP